VRCVHLQGGSALVTRWAQTLRRDRGPATGLCAVRPGTDVTPGIDCLKGGLTQTRRSVLATDLLDGDPIAMRYRSAGHCVSASATICGSALCNAARMAGSTVSGRRECGRDCRRRRRRVQRGQPEMRISARTSRTRRPRPLAATRSGMPASSRAGIRSPGTAIQSWGKSQRNGAV